MSSALSTFFVRTRPQPGQALAPREWLELYRVLPWEHKVSNARLLLYPLLAYAVAGPGDWRLRGLNLVALLGLLMFQGALNDYWDHRVSGERNRFGMTIAHLHPSTFRIAFWLAAPLAACLPAVVVLGREGLFPPALGLLLLGAVLSLAYSTPPVRLKARRGWAMLVAPCLTTYMFLEAVVLEARFRAAPAALLVLLFLFQLYAEAIHSLANASAHDEKCTPETAWRVARFLPVGHLLVALLLAFFRPWFLVSAAAAVVRLATLRRRTKDELRAQGQMTLTSPVLCLYEFAAYALLFATGVLR